MVDCVINGVSCNSLELKEMLRLCFLFLNQCKHLTEAYIIEYFTSNHWKKLPKSWQTLFQDFQPQDLAEKLLKPTTVKQQTVWPLSLLAFKKTSQMLVISRTTQSTKVEPGKNQNKFLKHIFRKHVNPKKQHEICVLAKVIERVFLEAKCSSVIDVGSGQGHLSRLLSIGYNLPVAAIECEGKFIEMAKKFDHEALLYVEKERSKIQQPSTEDIRLKHCAPRHVRYTISSDMNHRDLSDVALNCDLPHAEQDLKERYLLTGLHACGDLSATMIRIFKENENIQAIVSVACCYMKLTTDHEEDEKVFSIKASTCEEHYCYPMSSYVKGLENHELPYKSREVSCHAIENYLLRLQESGPHLKMHCYRAVLEHVIRKSHSALKRPGVQTIKKAYLLPFPEYVEKAFHKLNLPTPNLDFDEAEKLLQEWPKVVVYFTLALMVAPVVESAILLDRMVFLSEHELDSQLVSIFDPLLSPRCFAVIAKKPR